MRNVSIESRRRSGTMRAAFRMIAACCTSLVLLPAAQAQSAAGTAAIGAAIPASSSLPDAPSPQARDTGAVTVRNSPRHVLEDQKAIWTSPARVRTHDLVWLLPVAAAAGVALATDSHTMRSVVSHDAQFNHDNVDASNSLLATLVAVPVVNFAYGEIGNHAHAREAGILGGETLVDAAILEQGLKLAFWRERPTADNADGKFWQSSVGPDSSFPSSHTVFAWSTAAVIAGEYPSRWTQLTVYTLATGVSLTRVLGQEHFPSDVLVGSTVGWLAGHYVYKMRHRWQRHPN
jgi:membrane-associated phospholipid phosphatase